VRAESIIDAIDEVRSTDYGVDHDVLNVGTALAAMVDGRFEWDDLSQDTQQLVELVACVVYVGSLDNYDEDNPAEMLSMLEDALDDPDDALDMLLDMLADHYNLWEKDENEESDPDDDEVTQEEDTGLDEPSPVPTLVDDSAPQVSIEPDEPEAHRPLEVISLHDMPTPSPGLLVRQDGTQEPALILTDQEGVKRVLDIGRIQPTPSPELVTTPGWGKHGPDIVVGRRAGPNTDRIIPFDTQEMPVSSSEERPGLLSRAWAKVSRRRPSASGSGGKSNTAGSLDVATDN